MQERCPCLHDPRAPFLVPQAALVTPALRIIPWIATEGTPSEDLEGDPILSEFPDDMLDDPRLDASHQDAAILFKDCAQQNLFPYSFHPVEIHILFPLNLLF